MGLVQVGPFMRLFAYLFFIVTLSVLMFKKEVRLLSPRD